MAAAQRRPDRVVLVDLDLQFGAVATHLNLSAKQTLTDIVRDEAVLREPELLRTFAMRHDSGLHVIAAPTTPESSDFITPDHISLLIAALLEGYESVVIDAGSSSTNERWPSSRPPRPSCSACTPRSRPSRRCTACSTT